MNIELKRATIADAAAIHAMQCEAFLPLYQRYHDEATSPAKEPVGIVEARLRDRNTHYYLIEADARTVGAVRVVNGGAANGRQVYRISPLFVVPAYQNQGIGYSVIQKLFAIYENAEVWRLSTLKQEAGNRHLYEKCGFRATGAEIPVHDGMTIMDYEKQV